MDADPGRAPGRGGPVLAAAVQLLRRRRVHGEPLLPAALSGALVPGCAAGPAGIGGSRRGPGHASGGSLPPAAVVRAPDLSLGVRGRLPLRLRRSPPLA